jgi:quercetin dioxygenase-like cupin family protein
MASLKKKRAGSSVAEESLMSWMGRSLAQAAFLAAWAHVAAQPPPPPHPGMEDPRALATVVLDNARVRVLKASTIQAILDHPGAVVVPLTDGVTWKAGDAYWSQDPTAPHDEGGGDVGPLVIVAPKESALARAGPPPTAPIGSKPGHPPFVGMSFKPLFDNDRVIVIRGRMEVGAVEGFHTHASDIVVVHLSGGTIEDTANGKTKINRWKPGDVEFEAKGSSHSARNVGDALDAVLITLKP